MDIPAIFKALRTVDVIQQFAFERLAEKSSALEEGQSQILLRELLVSPCPNEGRQARVTISGTTVHHAMSEGLRCCSAYVEFNYALNLTRSDLIAAVTSVSVIGELRVSHFLCSPIDERWEAFNPALTLQKVQTVLSETELRADIIFDFEGIKNDDFARAVSSPEFREKRKKWVRPG